MTENLTVTRYSPLVSVTSNGNSNDSKPSVQYGNVGALLAGEIPPAPIPEILSRQDGTGLFYPGQVNMLFGDPETGKTFVALAAIVEAINDGCKAAMLDLDHNGMESIVSRLIDMGANQDALSSLDFFRYKEPEDGLDLTHTVADLQRWQPDIVVVDSIGELLPIYGLNSNSPDDFTLAHTKALKPLAMAGASVVVIDHLAKNPESKAQGPTGTGAKKRAVGGTMLRVTTKEPFTPGKGGSSYLNITKDRHGGLRAASPTGDGEPLAGTFHLRADSTYVIFAPAEGEQAPTTAPEDDVDRLANLTPPPESVADVRARMRWGTARASKALKAWRENPPLLVTDTQGKERVTTCKFHGTDYLPECYTCGEILKETA